MPNITTNHAITYTNHWTDWFWTTLLDSWGTSFTQTTWVEILCRKINLLPVYLKWWVNGPLQSINPNQLNKLKRVEKEIYCIATPQITSHIFWSFPNEMMWTIWFSNLNFRFSHVNSKDTVPLVFHDMTPRTCMSTQHILLMTYCPWVTKDNSKGEIIILKC